MQAEQEVRPSGDEPAHSTAQSRSRVGDGDSQEEHQSEEGIVDKNSLPNISMVFPTNRRDLKIIYPPLWKKMFY